MNNETKTIKFTDRVGSSKFSKTLSQRVNQYLKQQKNTKYGNTRMLTKTILGFACWIGTYLWIMSDSLSTTGLIGVYVLHGFAQLHMGLNIAHDANHNAFSKKKNINRIFGYVFDLVGLSSYIWRLQHNDSHHFFVNIRGADSSIDYDGIFRVSPRMKRRRYHRFQFIYAPILYCFSTLHWVFAKDYQALLEGRFGNHEVQKHPRKELIILFTAKVFYHTYTLILPLIFLSAPWYSILFAFFIMHMCIGLMVAVTFQPNHFTETSGFPELDENGYITNNYVKHVFENTADYARRNPLACWALGGLNLHMIHHMFPNICHVHYPALTKILRTTAKEYGLKYTEHKSLRSAFLAHLKWLYILGREDRNVLEEVM